MLFPKSTYTILLFFTFRFIYTIVSKSVMVYPRQQRTLETGGGCVTLEFNCDYTARPFQVTKEAKLHEVDLSCAILPLS